MDINPFITGGISLFSGLLGWWLGRRDNAKDRRRLAGLALAEKFHDELCLLRHYDTTNVVEILETAFLIHETAVKTFRFFLKGEELVAFDNAWFAYYADPKSKKKFLDQYECTFDATYPNGSARQTAIDRIETILAFTKDK